ncbi:MAG: T9SS type A sorting domain-containing protein [Bacteroidetes bacterium]|nr:T9SS type A sorting domain-containing protein [Bacteroidota bacterium]
MKKVYIVIVAGLILSGAFTFGPALHAQVVLKTDSITMGQYYANEIYYSMKNGEVSSYARNSWDIAFRTTIRSSSILTNDGYSVILWSYPKADTAGWASVDTSGLYTWTPMYNDPGDWENGAFSRNATGHPDYGWGRYNDQTHDVVGDSIFIIKLRNGSFRKLEIIRKNSVNNIYYFRFAKLDGTGQQDLSLNCNTYLAREFVGYSIETNEVVEYQPNKTDWDILFTKYMSIQHNGQPYAVTGVLNRDGVKSKTFYPVSLDYVDFTRGTWDSTRSAIGWEWKYIDTNYVYHIKDSTVYFVKSSNGEVVKLVFSKFAGSSTGLIVFKTGKVPGLGIPVNQNSGEISVYPNPATDLVHVTFTRTSVEPSILELTDISGRLVEKRLVNTDSGMVLLNVSGLGSGIYIIKLSSPEGSVIRKIMISR